jgi:flagellar biosynthetic protein FliO
MSVVAAALLAVLAQEAAGVELPPAPAAAPEAARVLIPEPAADRPVVERPESGPSLGSFLLASFLVLGLLVGAFVLLKRFGRNSRFLAGGGVIQVLARKPLGQRQEIFLVEVGPKVLVVGSTKEHLTTLGEIGAADDLAVLRAGLPKRGEDSARLAFRESLREGLREEETVPPAEKVYDSIAGELEEIRKTVKAWRA